MALVLVFGTNIAVLRCYIGCSKSSRQCDLYYLLTYRRGPHPRDAGALRGEPGCREPPTRDHSSFSEVLSVAPPPPPSPSADARPLPPSLASAAALSAVASSAPVGTSLDIDGQIARWKDGSVDNLD